jgi:general secretion pathway protein L
MGTLIIKMPSRAAADQVEHWIELSCAFALPAPEGGILREGLKPLSSLAPEISAARRLVLLIAASDVTVLRIKVPPLSAAQLQRALPSLVEDRLLSDPADCVVVPGPVEQGWCTVAVVQRIWLELLSRTVNAYGASAVIAVPTQLCLGYEQDVMAAALTEDERELVFRTGPYDGFGLPIEFAIANDREAAARHVLEMIDAVMPGRDVHLHVPARCLPTFVAVHGRLLKQFERITPLENGWSHMVKSIGQVEMNLLANAANAATVHRRDWRSFRFACGLALLVVAINLFGLNAEWLNMRHEAEHLRADMLQTYRTAFPNDKTILNPLMQMQQRVADASRAAGTPAADDFLALLARFGQAWSTAQQGSLVAPLITKLDYRDRTLSVALQPGNSDTMETLRTTAATQRLVISQTGSDSWQIRNTP